MLKSWLGAVTAIGLLASTAPANALLFDQDVSPNVIFGSGNLNGGWTVDTDNGVELGLRAKERFGPVLSAVNNTYSAAPGISTGTAATWNFEFAANVDVNGGGSQNLGNVTIVISIDIDPGIGTTFFSSDIFALFGDNAVGDNSTLPDGGTPTSDPGVFGPLNVAQNSQNLGFGAPPFFDPFADATFDFRLEAFDEQDTLLAQTDIRVIVGQGAPVPEPAMLPILGFGLMGIAVAAYRRRRLTS